MTNPDQTSSPQIPDVDPSFLDSLPGAFQFIVRKMLMSTDDMLPAKIITYDRTSNLALVQPLIKMVTTNNQLISRPSLASVPVVSLGGGGFHVSFPLKAGDLGWIEASDRDISLYLQSAYEESPPNTARIHSFSDARFLPDVMANYTIAAEDAENMVIQSTDGSTKISLGADFIKVVHLTTVLIETPLSAFSGNVAIAGGLSVAAALDITGDSSLTGKFGCNGATPQAPATISLATGGNNTTVINQIRAALIADGIGQP